MYVDNLKLYDDVHVMKEENTAGDGHHSMKPSLEIFLRLNENALGDTLRTVGVYC